MRLVTVTQPALPHIAAVSALAPPAAAWPDLPEPDLSGDGWFSSAAEAREHDGANADELVAALLRDALQKCHAEILRLQANVYLGDAPTLRMLREAADALIDVDANTSLHHLTRIAEAREWICQERGL